jgi:trans-aconitate 2-methyltransferase
MSHEWNAALYHQISGPQVSWGKKVLARVRLRGDEHVLDAGCGTGRLTRELLEALPRGQVTAVDLSDNMLRVAQQHLAPEFEERVHFLRADLQHLDLKPEYDIIFSTASFHWVMDHDQLFAGLYRALRPGGWLHAQCGSAGNIDRLLGRVDLLLQQEPYRQYFQGFASPWEYATAAVTAERLRRAGFVEIETSLEEAPTQFPNAADFQQFVESVILRRHLEPIPDAALRQKFLATLTEQAANDDPPFLLDYWRLNLRGRKPE